MKNVLAVLMLFAATLLTAQSAPVHIHRIYVDELHFRNNPDWDGLVRSKLMSSLVQECGSGCSVVEAIGPAEGLRVLLAFLPAARSRGLG
jgi:hypothetical protein